jgi:hypothetical protein
MNFSVNTDAQTDAQHYADSGVVLSREAGVPFQPPTGSACGIDPFVEWLSLMEVVQMLCPVWPVREEPMQGKHWRI